MKKCGDDNCNICKPSRLPPDIFSQIHHFPDLIPASDGHYKPFLHSPRKLSSIVRQELVTVLDDYCNTFTCGATLSDLELTGRLSEVCIRDLQCYNPLEKLYYSMNYDPICIHCCSEDNNVSVQGCYPQCGNCKHKEPMKKRV